MFTEICEDGKDLNVYAVKGPELNIRGKQILC